MCSRWVLTHYNCSDAACFGTAGAGMTREGTWKEVLLSAENRALLFTRFCCRLFCKEGAIKAMCKVLLLGLSRSFSCIPASRLKGNRGGSESSGNESILKAPHGFNLRAPGNEALVSGL